MIFGSVGFITRPEVPIEARLSVKGTHEVPPFVVFQSPPPAVQAKILPLKVGGLGIDLWLFIILGLAAFCNYLVMKNK